MYALEEGKKDETECFHEQLQKEINKYNKNDNFILAGDLNTRVGNQPISKTVVLFGENHINENAFQLRQFAVFNNIKLTNTLYKTKDIHKIYIECSRIAHRLHYREPLISDTG
jgi:hypothetical protein